VKAQCTYGKSKLIPSFHLQKWLEQSYTLLPFLAPVYNAVVHKMIGTHRGLVKFLIRVFLLARHMMQHQHV